MPRSPRKRKNSNIFAHGCIAMITRHTTVTSKIVTLIGNILTNFIFDTAIIRRDLSAHFLIFVTLVSSTKLQKEILKIKILKKFFGKE